MKHIQQGEGEKLQDVPFGNDSLPWIDRDGNVDTALQSVQCPG